MLPGEAFILSVQDEHTAALYLISGQLSVLGNTIKERQLVHFEQNGSQVAIHANEPARFIFFGGEPIKEKVVSYGPFVMNSMEAIETKIKAYQDGEMGVLEF